MANKIRQSLTTNMRKITDQGNRAVDTPAKQFVAYTGTIAAASGTVDVVIDTKGYSYIEYVIKGSANCQVTIYPRMTDGTKVTTAIGSTASSGKKLDFNKNAMGGFDSVIATIADTSATTNNSVVLEIGLAHNG